MRIELNDQIVYDLAVIGGGINGAGIARDAAGRGLKVLLCEKDDFGAHTSSASTKLIHGGLRYLEQYQFRLVRHCLKEREVLMRNAPHIVWPLRFVLPHDKSLRPRWLIRTGLFLYDSMAPMTILKKSKPVDLRCQPHGQVLKNHSRHGFEYSDCWVQDSRLVVLNVLAARQSGAHVLSRTRCIDLKRESDLWWVSLAADGERSMLSRDCRIRARAVVNATGAWVDQFGGKYHDDATGRRFHLIRGSHIVVRRLFDHPYAYIFQNDDGRILFCIPYEDDFTLIGTTEVEAGDPDMRCDISDVEIGYLCDSINRYLLKSTSRQDVVWSFSGVRALYDDGARNASQLSRDYELKHDDSMAPIVSVYGGKLTTYRVLAERVLELLSGIDGFDKPHWTAGGTLPGGDIGGWLIDEFADELIRQYTQFPDSMLARYARHYGSQAHAILHNRDQISDLGRQFAPGLYQAEVDYLIDCEFALTADDIIWRRTRQGIRMSSNQRTALAEYVDARIGSSDFVEAQCDERLYS